MTSRFRVNQDAGTARRTGFALAALLILISGCLSAGSDQVPERELPDYPRLRSEAYGTRFPYPNLVIEVDYARGFEPSEFALDALLATLEEVTDKDRITILPPTPLPDEQRFRSDVNWVEGAIGLHEEFFDSHDPSSIRYGEGDTAYLHLMYLNGRYEGNKSAAMGLATSRTIFIFPSYFREKAGLLIRTANQIVPDDTSQRIERSVLIHEMGHMMGLVNGGAPMVRDHDDGTRHSSNPKSVMHRGIEASLGPRTELLDNEYPYKFDHDDLADLRALQERARQSHRSG